MAIKVHGHPLSPAVKRVVACLEEKSIPYEFVLIDLSIESRAITQYIAHAYADKGTPLISNDPKKMAIVSIWTEVESQRFDGSASKLSFEIVVKPILGMTTDEGVVDHHQATLAQILDVYESRLSQSKYLGGDEFSLADLHHIPIINNLFGTKIKALFEARPHVSAWCNDILGRPAWQKVQASMKL
ncbi:hypothetical protein DH2020_013844 [Rehmannia glutinosa]|uniref:glutathione transferase n=1 Tax=Rehmannia glutinosa TaxID=99300 RepID=A0ABR0X423_REHGL